MTTATPTKPAAKRKPKSFPKKADSRTSPGEKTIACAGKTYVIVEMLAEAANVPRSRMLDMIVEEYATQKLAKISFK